MMICAIIHCKNFAFALENVIFEVLLAISLLQNFIYCIVLMQYDQKERCI